MKIYILSIIFLLTINSFVFSQEYLFDLQVNPIIKTENKTANRFKDKKILNNPITLPFFDDFTSKDIFPDTSHWIDNYAFINNSYPVCPVSIGVATLDAIDNTGAIYADASIYPFIADHLTSRHIRLDSIFTPRIKAISARDSVYLSFFYQPQGNGNAPETKDSLILEFFVSPADTIILPPDTCITPADTVITPADTSFIGNDTIITPADTSIYPPDTTINIDSTFIAPIWQKIWSTEGMTLDTFYSKNNTYFKQVMIPILDSTNYPDSINFFKKDFQFRFVNYASIANLPSWRSNADYWNIDYVYINIGRNRGDTVYKDITFVKNAPSLLKHYQSMPYRQYCKEPLKEMQDTLDIFISNLDNITHNYSYKYIVTNQKGEDINTYLGGSYNIEPFYNYGYQDWQPHSHPPVRYILPIGYNADSASFVITHIISGDSSLSRLDNDTIRFYQKLYNYYAYDDGTAEAGYGLEPANAQLAYKFKLNGKDTIRAVRMYFNQTLNGANQKYFYLRIWDDNGGKPGDIIYEQRVEPLFEDGLNKFHTYVLDSAVPAQDFFYVGWEQTTNDNLNIGFDKNDNSQKNIFYKTSSEWHNTMFHGSLMIRPVIGKKFHLQGINPIHNDSSSFECKIFPNPIYDGTLHIILPSKYDNSSIQNNLEIKIYNIFGQSVLYKKYQKTLNVSSLRNGIYIIQVINNKNNEFYTDKLIISR